VTASPSRKGFDLPAAHAAVRLTDARPAEGGRDAMGKFMKNIEKFAKSPKAKAIEKKMVRKAKDPKTQAKVSKRFKKWKAKH
jgi:hypothetical protein